MESSTSSSLSAAETTAANISHSHWGGSMRRFALALLGALVSFSALMAQGDPQPTCKNCPGTYIPNSEIQAYVQKAIAEKRTDQQVRDVNIGKSHIGIGVVYRGKLAAPAPEPAAHPAP